MDTTVAEAKVPRQARTGNKVPTFLDTGAGDNFISPDFAKTLIKIGYKISHNSHACLVCRAFNDNYNLSRDVIKFKLQINDDFGNIYTLV